MNNRTMLIIAALAVLVFVLGTRKSPKEAKEAEEEDTAKEKALEEAGSALKKALETKQAEEAKRWGPGTGIQLDVQLDIPVPSFTDVTDWIFG